MNTTRMTTAQAIVRFLSQQYVERDGVEQRFVRGVIGIFGHGNVSGLGQALEEVGRDLQYHQSRNEQAQVHTATAYAKMKNRLQTFACTSSVGPGATNMVTGAATATIDRIPVLLLPGDIFANRLPHPVLQGLEFPGSQDVSVNDCFRPVSRYWDRINRPEQILAALPAAMRTLTDQAETGAVTVCLPEDVQAEGYDFPSHFFAKRVYHIPRPVPAEPERQRAVELMRTAKRPLIIAGGGVIYSEASCALGEAASTFGIPVCETQAGKGSLPWSHPWNVGAIGVNGGFAANRLAAQADLVITVGTRLTDFTTASMSAFQNPDVRFLSINVAALDAYKVGAVPLVGDARATLQALHASLSEAGYRTDEAFQIEVRGLKCEWDDTVSRIRTEELDGRLTEPNVIGIVNEFSRPRDVMINAAGGMPGELLKLWRTEDPKGYHVEYGYSCMGYEIAGGLGIKMADPSRDVYVMVGDGSYLMLNSEIVTSLQEGCKLIIVVVDNYGFQCIRGLQQSTGSPAFGNEFRYRDERSGRLEGGYIPVDFTQNAASLGAAAYFADSRERLLEALEAARQDDRTAVIHVPVDVDAHVPSFESWWDVPVAEVSSQEGVRQGRTAYAQAKQRQRYYY